MEFPGYFFHPINALKYFLTISTGHIAELRVTQDGGNETTNQVMLTSCPHTSSHGIAGLRIVAFRLVKTLQFQNKRIRRTQPAQPAIIYQPRQTAIKTHMFFVAIIARADKITGTDVKQTPVRLL
ncbi:hypothetical protein AKJ29_03275 [Aliiroseovarius crassostreae]|uniref:Uncharacterized protein n=1 Tax=Aliiroseovarius crassostreae TaxID=154981 RepID=A0A0N8IAZ0_9RHOB|nr:hypothetical protein AKJ29_03275 [Aliiroseovarius crassostreae]